MKSLSSIISAVVLVLGAQVARAEPPVAVFSEPGAVPVDAAWHAGALSGPETTGLFVDNVELDAGVVPAPSLTWLVGLGLVALAARRRVANMVSAGDRRA